MQLRFSWGFLAEAVALAACDIGVLSSPYPPIPLSDELRFYTLSHGRAEFIHKYVRPQPEQPSTSTSVAHYQRGKRRRQLGSTCLRISASSSRLR
jgi:hypothetical protein